MTIKLYVQNVHFAFSFQKVICIIKKLKEFNYYYYLNSFIICFQQYLPDLTIALWVYTQGSGDMTIISNGLRNAAGIGNLYLPHLQYRIYNIIK